MKKTTLVIVTLVLLVGVTFWVSRAMRSASPRSVDASRPANIEDLNGKRIPLDRYSGKVLLVNYWATWCNPCRFEIPSLIELQQKYAGRGFTVLGVATDDERDEVIRYVREQRFDVNGKQEAISYPILLGNDAASDQFGGLIGLPTSFLISRDRKLVKRLTGLVNHEELVKEIEPLL